MNINDPFYCIQMTKPYMFGQNERFGGHRKCAVSAIIAVKNNTINGGWKEFVFVVVTVL